MTAKHVDTRSIVWNRTARDAVALVILPWPEGPGITICKRDRDGKLYGCRDVTRGEHFASIVEAWKADALKQGLTVDTVSAG